jgi:hypothetical protein
VTMVQRITPHIVVRPAEHAAAWYANPLGAGQRGCFLVPVDRFSGAPLRTVPGVVADCAADHEEP